MTDSAHRGKQARRIISTALEMGRRGINCGRAGNVSARFDSDFLITPSGLDYDGMSDNDIVLVDNGGEAHGNHKPSSEWRFHFDIYAARADVQAIVHAHPTACVALACLGKRIPPFHYMVAAAGGSEIPLAAYATFGSQDLSDNILAAMGGLNACLMANHGLLCVGKSLDSALSLAVEIEQLAASYLQCLAVGQPVILGDDEMQRVLKKFETYGSNLDGR